MEVKETLATEVTKHTEESFKTIPHMAKMELMEEREE